MTAKLTWVVGSSAVLNNSRVSGNRIFLFLQIFCFFNASEYLAKVSVAAFKRKLEGKQWLEEACHTLKHEAGGAEKLLKEMKSLIKKKISSDKKETIEKS
jgi:hypothetical protein